MNVLLERGRAFCKCVNNRHLADTHSYFPLRPPRLSPSQIDIAIVGEEQAIDVYTLYDVAVEHTNRLAYGLDILFSLGVRAFGEYMRALLFANRPGVILRNSIYPHPPTCYQVPNISWSQVPLMTLWDLHKWRNDLVASTFGWDGHAHILVRNVEFWMRKFQISLG